MDDIRALQVQDYDQLIALWQQAGLRSAKTDGRDSRAAIARQLQSGLQTILGLENDGQLVGAVMATHDGRKGWINRLAIDPQFRRRGYGLQLVEAAEQVLRQQGIQIIAVLVEGDNAASFNLFQKAGYVDYPGIHYMTKRDSSTV
ncbi:MAG: GNAT family N-acetyltransferase [Anaerolineae bacterium]|nr:GNAT family N-acetyltransferase [Anaerolineae bacterium]